MTKDQRIAELEDRIEELEMILGTAPLMSDGYRALGLTKTESEILGVLMKRVAVAREQMFVAIYGTVPEDKQPQIKVLDVMISRIRKTLKPHDIKIGRNYSDGWLITAANKQKIRDWLAAYLASAEAGVRPPHGVPLLSRRGRPSSRST